MTYVAPAVCEEDAHSSTQWYSEVRCNALRVDEDGDTDIVRTNVAPRDGVPVVRLLHCCGCVRRAWGYREAACLLQKLKLTSIERDRRHKM